LLENNPNHALENSKLDSRRQNITLTTSRLNDVTFELGAWELSE